MRPTRLLLSAGLITGLIAVPTAAGADPAQCPDKTVGSTLHEVDQIGESTPAAPVTELVIHDTLEPIACEALP
jgi:hypothetical protein